MVEWFAEVRRLFVAIIALIGACHAVPAAANTLFDRSCLLASDTYLSFAAARSATAEWNCQPDFKNADTGHSWLRIPADNLPSGEIALSTASAPLESVRIVVMGKNGDVYRQTYRGSQISHLWQAGNRMGIPINIPGQDVAMLYAAFDGEANSLPATEMAIVRHDAVHSQRLIGSVLFAAICAVLLTVALFCALIGMAVGNRLAVLHAAFSTLVALYTVSSSSLIFLLVPELTPWWRSALSYASLALAMAVLTPIVMYYFEPALLTRRMKVALLGSSLFVAPASLALPATLMFDYDARFYYHIMYLPGIATLTYITIAMVRRGSRAVNGFILAWILPTICGIERVLRGTGLYYLPDGIETLFFVALGGQAVIMAVMLALQAERIRRERDQANNRAMLMADEALSDALTGLPNRRHFDTFGWRAEQFIGIIDLDRFKIINDTYGHETGDQVLAAVGAAIAEVVGEAGVAKAWRLGGEEMAIAINADSVHAAALTLNQLRGRISAEIATRVPMVEFQVTSSAGLAPVGNEVRQAFRAADSALYQAKAGGRDRLCFETPEGAVSTIFPRPAVKRRQARAARG